MSLASQAVALVQRKIWLPRTLYDSVPWFYLFASLSSLAATFYINASFLGQPQYLLFSAACLHLGILVFRRRWLRRNVIA